MYKIFISWSKSPSREVAILVESYLKKILPYPNIDWFLSASQETGIESGERFLRILDSKLEKSDFGILILTKNNYSSPWILFEAGALSKNILDSKVVPLLINREKDYIEPPLKSFHYSSLTKNEFTNLVKSIAKSIFNVKKLNKELNLQLEDRISKTWGDFINDIDVCIKENTSKIKEITNDVQSFMMDENAYEQILSKRETHLKQLVSTLDSNKERRLIIVGGISTTLRSAETIRKLSVWLINNPNSKLFICHENINVAEQRAKDLRDAIFDKPQEKKEEIRRRKIDEFEKMKISLLNTIGDKIAENLHFIEVTKPLSVYITILGKVIYLTPVLDKRSSDTFTFKLTQNSLLIEVLDYISSRINITDINTLLLEEIEIIKKENEKNE